MSESKIWSGDQGRGMWQNAGVVKSWGKGGSRESYLESLTYVCKAMSNLRGNLNEQKRTWMVENKEKLRWFRRVRLCLELVCTEIPLHTWTWSMTRVRIRWRVGEKPGGCRKKCVEILNVETITWCVYWLWRASPRRDYIRRSPSVTSWEHKTSDGYQVTVNGPKNTKTTISTQKK